jgi:nodulation protein E
MTVRRVAVTGIGTISALGLDRRQFWDSLCQGRCGIAPIEAVDRTHLRFPNGAQVRGYRAVEHLDERLADYLDRFAQFALIAAREAVQDAGLEWTPAVCDRTAVVTGSCLGGQSSEDHEFSRLYRESATRAHPFTVPRVMANAAASYISMEFGVTGPTYTLSTACSSSNHAIGMAFHMVRQGMADVALTGGSEAPFSLGHLMAWDAMRVVAPDTCRPFSRDRRGMILGEGSGMLVLETMDLARARGAPIYAEIVGFGMSADAHHITQPSVEGPVRALRAALEDGALRPEQINYVNAHGTGTTANDVAETRAVRTAFGEHANQLMVSSTKSMHGHALGAAGALEAAVTILALRHGTIPPTVNYLAPDPECDLDVVPNVARQVQIEAALSNSFAFGGLNAVLAFQRSNA